MDKNDFKMLIQRRLIEMGISGRMGAVEENLPQDVIRKVLDGHDPRLSQAIRIAAALGLEFHVGPPKEADDIIKNNVDKIAAALDLPPDATSSDLLPALAGLKVPRFWSVERLPDDLPATAPAHQETDQPGLYRALDRANALIGSEDIMDGDTLLRVSAALQAIEISPLCTDAYLDLAKDLRLTHAEERIMVDTALRAAELVLGEEIISLARGELWSVLEARPYMNARWHQAELVRETGDWRSAVNMYFALIELDNNDHLGCRFPLLSCLLHLDDKDRLLQVLEQFNDKDTFILYTRTLVEFKYGGGANSLAAHRSAKQAYRANLYVPKILDEYDGSTYGVDEPYGAGSELEALNYADEFGRHWFGTEGAIDWLLKSMKIKSPRKPTNAA